MGLRASIFVKWFNYVVEPVYITNAFYLEVIYPSCPETNIRTVFFFRTLCTTTHGGWASMSVWCGSLRL